MERALLAAGHFSPDQTHLIELTEQMIEAIRIGDADAYAELCAPDLSCYEDVCSHRIDGIAFHTALIAMMSRDASATAERVDLLEPRVQVYGDTGIVTYTRLMTYSDSAVPRWVTFNETRVFVCIDGKWRMAHFHRSKV